MDIKHQNLMRAGFENTHNGTMWMYQKGEVHVAILRENGSESEIIIHVNNKKRDKVYNMKELKSLCS